MSGSSGVSVVRPNTGLPDDPGEVVAGFNPAEVVRYVCGRIPLGKNPPHNQERVPSLPLDRKLACGSVNFSNNARELYLLANTPIRCSPLTKVTIHS